MRGRCHLPSVISVSRDDCRICGYRPLWKYLDLGATPLANSYLRDADANEPSVELAVQLCRFCGLSLLTRVVDPDVMFRDYLYVSSTSATFRQHCSDFAAAALRRLSLRQGDVVVDIASNDGCLLSQFKELGLRVMGVDPAINLAQEANEAGIPTLCAYWSASAADTILERLGRPRLITATNVVAHVDDLHGFIAPIASTLPADGAFVIECPYVLDMLTFNEFDTVYHEHLSYLGITSLQALVAAHGLEIFDVEHFPKLHGGTIRVWISPAGRQAKAAAVDAARAREKEFGLTDRPPYEKFSAQATAIRRGLSELLRTQNALGRTVWAYGASAKGNTLINSSGLTARDVPVVIDDNPKKWGYLTPGARMEIRPSAALRDASVDYLLLLAWNFQDEIIRRCLAAGYKGGFIVPVPVPTLIEADEVARG